MGVRSHFHHVCLPQESLFQVFQAIKRSRVQISSVIRRNLEQKEKCKPVQTPFFPTGDQCLLAHDLEFGLVLLLTLW